MDLSHPFSVVTPTVDGDVLQILASAEAAFTPPQVHGLADRHSVSGIRKALTRLTSTGIVTTRRVGNAFSYELNREHLAAPHVAAIAHLRAELLDRMTARIGEWSSSAEYAALFGSAATGQMHPDSDIDVLVVRPDSVELDDARWRRQLDDFACRVTGWTGNDTRVLEFAAAEVLAALATDGEPVLIDIREHGIRLHGRSDYLRPRHARAVKQ